MGLSPSTTLLVFLLCAILRAGGACTITLLPSLADPGGIFDVRNAKCPPDRGSSDCVTGSLASVFSTSPNRISPSPSPEPKFQNSIIYPPTPPPEAHSIRDYISHSRTSAAASLPKDIPGRAKPPPASHNLATPPLTPDDGNDTEDSESSGAQSKDALDFLLTIFPRDGLDALPFAKSVAISSPNMGSTFEGVILELPGKPKALYVDGKSAQSVSLRESIVALLDLADECFQCSALVIALDRSSPALGDLLHSFMYVGGNVVTKPPFQVDPAYLLVGLEI